MQTGSLISGQSGDGPLPRGQTVSTKWGSHVIQNTSRMFYCGPQEVDAVDLRLSVDPDPDPSPAELLTA